MAAPSLACLSEAVSLVHHCLSAHMEPPLRLGVIMTPLVASSRQQVEVGNVLGKCSPSCLPDTGALGSHPLCPLLSPALLLSAFLHM